MLEELFHIHHEVMEALPTTFNRYLYSSINWDARGICITGDRGVGKTTMLCQNLLQRYQTVERALYISADHINVISYGLFEIAKQYFMYGGEALYIDEIHKYPEWSTEIKNILDTYKKKQVLFSASSSLDLNRSKADLSRRVVYYKLLGLSFREYLLLAANIEVSSVNLTDLMKNHVAIASNYRSIPLLKYFREYLNGGYYPFFMEGQVDYLPKVNNVIEKVLYEDITVVYNLRPTTLPILKKILWLVATSNGLMPNIDKMSKNLGVSREMVYNCLEYLGSSGLLNELMASSKGNALIRKPGKVYLNNTNLLAAINGSLKLETDVGGIRETFFVNQVSGFHKIALHDHADFVIDDHFVFEVGGKSKKTTQLQNEKNGFLAIDDTPIGFGNKIPLYLFGFLY